MFKISIIVPAYNVEKYIEDCIQSIKNQSYKNFEVLIVDDGSTDHSSQLLDDLTRDDERFIVIHQDNGGAARARNKALDICTGDYICFVDADDFLDSDYLEVLLYCIVHSDCDIVQCNYVKTQERTLVDRQSERKENIQLKIISNMAMLNRIYSEYNVDTIVLWNKIYKASILKTLRFPEGIMFEDEVFSTEAIYFANCIGLIEQELYYYYVNNAGVMNRTYSLRKLDILRALQLRMDFYKQKNLLDLYQKDSYKYLYKILQNYYHIQHSLKNNKKIKKIIRQQYWVKYRECLHFDWSMKRKVAMLIFGLCPLIYSWFRKV